MTTLRVPPGRAGRLWLRYRLDIARRGSDLLERKLRILRDEYRRHQDAATAAEQNWQRCVADAETWLLRADLVGGAGALGLAAHACRANVTVRWATTMGVYHPTEGVYAIAPVAPTAATPASAALAEARNAYRAAAAAAVLHAVASAAVARLASEVATTAQRVRALRRRWIPRLEEALARAEFELEELERAEALRRLRATSP